MKKYSFKINGRAYDVQVESIDGGTAKVNVNGTSYDVELPADNATATSGVRAAQSAGISPSGNADFAASAAPISQVAPASRDVREAEKSPSGNASLTSSAAPAAGAAAATVVSPMPGVIIDVCVTPGQSVKRGQKLAVLEAMKMENDILAESDGSVVSVFVNQGDSVLEGAKIVTIG